MNRNMFSTRDAEDVLEGRLFLVDVSDATKDHVMHKVRQKALSLVKSGRWNSREFPWYLKVELENEIERILSVDTNR